jgi:hypothetical protein
MVGFSLVGGTLQMKEFHKNVRELSRSLTF